MFAAYQRLGVPVTASNLAVIRAAQKRLQPAARRNPALREFRRTYYRRMLAQHREAQMLVILFRL